MHKRILFRCCTFYQLINAINVKLTLLTSCKADIILNSSTDFSGVVNGLREADIFDRVEIMPDSLDDNRAFRKMNSQEKEEWFSNIENNMYAFPFEGTDYSDYYMAVNDEYNTFIYYYLIKKGYTPKVHIFEESKATYILSILNVEKKDGIPHSSFHENNMYKNIVEILLYEPQFYDADLKTCTFTKIPKIDCSSDKVKDTYTKIFGFYELPKERYIYLVSPFFWDKFSSSEMDVIDEVAESVGKENLVLKMHPRDQIDRYTNRGYKLLRESKIPWEIIMMGNDMSKYVLLSISSNASATADLVFGKQIWTIHLEELMLIGKTHNKLKKFVGLDKKMIEVFNEKNKYIFKPETKEQLVEQLKYIERKINYGNAK